MRWRGGKPAGGLARRAALPGLLTYGAPALALGRPTGATAGARGTLDTMTYSLAQYVAGFGFPGCLRGRAASADEIGQSPVSARVGLKRPGPLFYKLERNRFLTPFLPDFFRQERLLQLVEGHDHGDLQPQEHLHEDFAQGQDQVLARRPDL